MKALLKTITASAAITALIPAAALAQVQGARGTTSTGEVQLSLSVEDLTAAGEVRITGLQNGFFGSIPKNSTGQLAHYNTDVCLWHTSPSFRLTVSRVSNPEKGLGLMIVSQNGDTIPITTKYGYGAFETYMTDGVTRSSLTALSSSDYSDTCVHRFTGAVAAGGRISYFVNNETGRLPVGTAPGTYLGTFRWTMAAE
jgi:hypothetical protein